MTEMEDTRTRSWILVQNNYQDFSISPESFEADLSLLPSVRFWCYALEEGLETHTPHIQAYFVAKNPMRFSALKKKFPHAHIEPAKGTPEQNRDYVRKSGKWEETEKAETSIQGIYREWGELPAGKKGKRTDLEKIYALIEQGYSNVEIMKTIGDSAVRNIDKLDKIRQNILYEQYKTKPRLNLKVHFIFGETGTGKSRSVLDEYGYENVYRISDYSHPFDSYANEPVIVFEEFRGEITLPDMLKFLDIYPCTLPARYQNKVACYENVFIITNWEFERLYEYIKKDISQKSTYEAFKRRINGYVKHYISKDEIITYNSLEEYLNRNNTFQLVSDNVIPFETKEESFQQEEIPFLSDDDDEYFLEERSKEKMNDNKLHITYADNEILTINPDNTVVTVESFDTATMTTHVLFLCKKICQCMLSLGYDIESSITCTDILNMIFSPEK